MADRNALLVAGNALAGAALVLAGAAVFAGGLWVGRAPAAPGPALSVPAERLDLGDVGAEPALAWPLPVTNVSGRPQRVRFAASCECTAVEPAEFELAAGERREVLLTLNLEPRTAAELEPAVRDVSLELTAHLLPSAHSGSQVEAASPSATQSFQLAARVQQPYRLEPSFLVFDEGDLAAGEFYPRRARLDSAVPWRRLEARCDPRFGQAQAAADAGNPRRWSIEVTPAAALGPGGHEFESSWPAPTRRAARSPPGGSRSGWRSTPRRSPPTPESPTGSSLMTYWRRGASARKRWQPRGSRGPRNWSTSAAACR